MSPKPWLTPVDRRLLGALADAGTLVEACRRIGIGRDRGVYRIRRLEKGWNRSLTQSTRGGGGTGGTRLTAFGRRLLRSAGGEPTRAPSGGWNRLTGIYRGGEPPVVELPGQCRLVVAFRGRPGSRVRLRIAPDALLVAPGRFPSSARNVLRASAIGLRPRGAGRVEVTFRTGGIRLRALLTEASVRALGLRPGVASYLYLKATAVRPEPGAGRRGLRRS
ncbi:MAG: TOBE domain-containing protein [Thermoplasmata archaeon]|jgi:molybdopterin-binding protein/molybdate transport repressor ModE-like protein